MLLRGSLGGSRLVGQLGEWAAVEVEPARQDLAERMSGWLNPFDAIQLHAVLQSVNAMRGNPRPGASDTAGADAADQFQQVRDAMVQAIASHELWGVPQRRPVSATATRHTPPTDTPDDPSTAYSAYRKAYLDLQRQMEAQAATLRARIRQEMSRVSAQLRQLATLDATLEQMLGESEQKLLATVPTLLEKRFLHWRQRHQSRLALTDPPDEPAQWRQPGGWLHGFGQDLQQALVAEWQVRLQPAEGLLEALVNDLKK